MDVNWFVLGIYVWQHPGVNLNTPVFAVQFLSVYRYVYVSKHVNKNIWLNGNWSNSWVCYCLVVIGNKMHPNCYNKCSFQKQPVMTTFFFNTTKMYMYIYLYEWRLGTYISKWLWKDSRNPVCLFRDKMNSLYKCILATIKDHNSYNLICYKINRWN